MSMKSASACRVNGDKIKYSAVKRSEESVHTDQSEKSPLLENIEILSISAEPSQNEQTSGSKTVTKLDNVTGSRANEDSKTGTDCTNVANRQANDSNTNNNDVNGAKSTEKCATVNTEQGARPKQPNTHNSRDTTSGGSKETPKDNSIDIVRKMSQPLSDDYMPWRQVGSYQELKQKKCQRLHAATGRADDLAIFFHNGRFYVMEAWCTHMGGPLFEGDIEDYNGRCHVMCPWHSYMFDLETGKNEIGLQQKVHELKLENGQIYVRYHADLSITSNRKSSQPSGPRVINRPPEGKHEKMRKQSVLDTPMKL